jgi:tetratricopeptide (TPR) repeat protein
MLRAQVAIAKGRVDAALADLARIPDSDKLAPQARLRAGQLELRRDRLRAAEEAFRAALRLAPDLVQAHRELIYIYGMQGRRAEIDAQFRALAKLTPLTFDNALHWGLMSHESWQPDKVTEELGRFTKADPTDRWSRLAWADSLRRVGRVDDAWKALEPLPDSDPEARALRALLALERGDRATAKALLLEGPTDHAGLARLRGRLALAERDGQAALRHFTVADAAEPGSRDVTLGLAQAWTLIGDEAKAKRYLEAAKRRDAMFSLLNRARAPGANHDVALFRELGEACAADGRPDEARAWLALALAHDPLDAEAQRALFRLRAGADSDPVERQTTTAPSAVPPE